MEYGQMRHRKALGDFHFADREGAIGQQGLADGLNMEVQGRDHLIRFRGEPLRMVSKWVHEYERFWTQRLDRFEEYFRQKGRKKP